MRASGGAAWTMPHAVWKVMQHQISLFKLHAKRDVDASAANKGYGSTEMLHVLVWIVLKHRRSLAWEWCCQRKKKIVTPFQKFPPFTPVP